MSVQFYPNGVGGTAPGDQLDLAKPLQMTGNVWYVSSLIGTNAAAPAGQNREKPLATLVQACTNAADDDIIVMLAGHTETLAGLVITKRLILIGEGVSGGKPAVTLNSSTALPLQITGSNTEFRNLYFPAAASPGVTAKIDWAAAGGRIIGCYFDCGATDTAPTVLRLNGSDQMRIESCTFISTAVSTTAQPTRAILTSTVTADLEIINTVISAGTVGFSNYAAVDLSGNPVTRCKFIGLSLLLGADVDMGASATGFVNVELATGGSRVRWG